MVRQRAELTTPDDDGVTQLEHLNSLYEKFKDDPNREKFKVKWKPTPKQGEWLLFAFYDMDRTYTEGYPNPFTLADFKLWCETNNEPMFSRWERDRLRSMDNMFLNTYYNAKNGKDEQPDEGESEEGV